MRLKEDDSSWHSGGIKRRMYRQAPLMPEDETPRHKSTSKKYKKKHVHTFKSRIIGKQTLVERYWSYDGPPTLLRREYEADKVTTVCTGCGYKRTPYYRGR